MDMEYKYRVILIIGLFTLNMTIVSCNTNLGDIINFLGSTTIPLMIYVFPGYIYYHFLKMNRCFLMENYRAYEEKLSLSFAILGGILIVVYTSTNLYTMSKEY